MKFTSPILIIAILTSTLNCKNDKKTSETDIKITEEKIESSVKVIPINHGTLILESKNEVIYIDPTGGKDAFKSQKQATLILITDIHGDHLNIETLTGLDLKNATIVAPKAVIDKLPQDLGKNRITLNNGDSYKPELLNIRALPMYNLREEALKFHPKGRGNGYVITIDGERIYISGDTEDIPEMRDLKDIDKAFVCMNLPYTMTVENAASAILDFKPKVVFPYHYRGSEGLSDIAKFKEIVNSTDKTIVVQFLDWY